MAKEEKTCCCGEKNEILHGFKFGFGFFLAFLAGWSIVTILSIVLYYLLKAIGLGF